jgi:hypothetical protein
MRVIGYNYRPDVMNGLGVWDTKNGVGNHVNMEALAEMRWGGSAPQRRDQTNDSESGGVDIDRRLELTPDDSTGGCGGVFRTMMYPDKEVHILSLTFDSFFMSNVSGSSDFAQLFPFLLTGGCAPQRR